MVPVTKNPSLLPDLCLENVFKRIPLFDLIRSVRLVCANWGRVAPTELRRRRKLVLVQNFDNLEMIQREENPFGSELIERVQREEGSPWVQLRSIEQICFNALLLPGGLLTEGFTTPLMETLPSITHLTVVHSDIESLNTLISILQQLVRLLNHYGNQLVSLKLTIHYPYYQPMMTRGDLMTNFNALFDSLNQLESLRHLTWNVMVYNFGALTRKPRLSILSRLDTFFSNNTEAGLLDSIRQYAITGNVRIDWQPNLSMEKFLALHPKLASKFSSIRVSGYLRIHQHENLRLFSTRFNSLSHLTLLIDTMPMASLARSMSPLTQLIHLRLEFYRVLPEDEMPQPKFVQVSSVRLLTLSFSTRSHFETERLHLAETFPNLQVLRLNQFILSCDVCDFINQVGRGPNVAELECIRLTRKPFRRCAHLHTIKLFGRFEDLFPDNLITRNQF